MTQNQLSLLRAALARDLSVTSATDKRTAYSLFRRKWLKLVDTETWTVRTTELGCDALAEIGLGDDSAIWVAALNEAAKIAERVETQQENDNGAANTGGAAAAARAIRSFAAEHFRQS